MYRLDKLTYLFESLSIKIDNFPELTISNRQDSLLQSEYTFMNIVDSSGRHRGHIMVSEKSYTYLTDDIHVDNRDISYIIMDSDDNKIFSICEIYSNESNIRFQIIRVNLQDDKLLNKELLQKLCPEFFKDVPTKLMLEQEYYHKNSKKLDW